MGPDEPDTALYAGYPITRDSWRRKLRRDVTGDSAYKNFRALVGATRKRRSEALQILAVQAVMLGASIVFMRPLAYVVWIGSWSTLWKVSNRLRAIAEHGGMVRSRDRRQTTHVIRQCGWRATGWCRTTPVGTSPTTSTWACRGEPAAAPRGAGRRRMGHARDRVPELPRVLAGLLAG